MKNDNGLNKKWLESLNFSHFIQSFVIGQSLQFQSRKLIFKKCAESGTFDEKFLPLRFKKLKHECFN